MAAPNRSPMRVLIRPPTSSSLPPPSTAVPPPSATPYQQPTPSSLPPLPPPSTTSQRNGVVVVGFVGRRKGDVSQLINRIIDDNVFGSGNGDLELGFDEKGEILSEEVKDWFKQRRISYYHEETKGVLYLQFSSTKCPAMEGFSEVPSGFDSVFEEYEFGDLQGMLFMFSVCHVIIYVQEGSRFNIQILKKFRVLQAAKNAIFPFIKSQTPQPLTARSHPSSSSRTSPSGASSKNCSPGKNGPPMNRNPSSITLMSGLGSYTSLFPGQCTPVILFVFLDDIYDSGSNPDEKTTLPLKGSGSVVVLSRPIAKSEGGFRKKLQSSLEAQIRFSIKKCRVLAGSEMGHGSRSGTGSNYAPLFSLDASKAVSLLDRLSNQRGESLEFAMSILEDVLNGVSTSDSLLLESHSQSSNKEDILSVKEFISRQCDILRGRGSMVTNTNSVSAAGVGMVAVAAAAAAASVASGKTFTTPELPNLDVWLTSSRRFLHELLSAKHGFVPEPEPEPSKRKPRQRNNILPTVEVNSSKVNDPFEVAVTCLDSCRGLNTKFSTLWCQRALPIAKDVYLNDLPKCYPTSQHEAHLEKALCAFKSMVKGPSVQNYLKKLEDECKSIWSSDRQLCDAISLTGKSCIHQRHDMKSGDLTLCDDVRVKPHCSGFVFLHACACGRSRKLRSDPFDFETANVTFNCYPECDKLLPTLNLPEGDTMGPIQSSSWSLIRIGGSRYYQPSKGLLQSGFSATEKFLFKWKFFLGKQMEPMNGLGEKAIVEAVSDESMKKADAASGEIHKGVDFHKKSTSGSNNSEDNKISFTRGVPSFTMRKPFSEVVAGSAAKSSGFPPLQSKKKASPPSEKVTKEKMHGAIDNQESKNVNNISSLHETVNENGKTNGNGNPFLQMGSNEISVTIKNREQKNQRVSLNSLNHAIVYIGFEHECPGGHRFILTPEHLNGLGSIYAADEEFNLHSSVENTSRKMSDFSRVGKNGKIHRHSTRGVRNIGKSKEVVAHGNQGEDIEGSLRKITLDDDGVFPLLNRNLPLYLNCPHCQIHKNKTNAPNVKFAGTISQLQRIFLVTPPFPVVLATRPVIQFEASCLPPYVEEREQKLQFSLGCPVVLPPESFLSLRLPFVYGVQLEDGSQYPLKPFVNQPELTAWITKSTTLQILSTGSNLEGI